MGCPGPGLGIFGYLILKNGWLAHLAGFRSAMAGSLKSPWSHWTSLRNGTCLEKKRWRIYGVQFYFFYWPRVCPQPYFYNIIIIQGTYFKLLIQHIRPKTNTNHLEQMDRTFLVMEGIISFEF